MPTLCTVFYTVDGSVCCFARYLVIECESAETPSSAAVQQSDGKFQEMYSVVLRRLLKALSHGPSEWKERGLVLR